MTMPDIRPGQRWCCIGRPNVMIVIESQGGKTIYVREIMTGAFWPLLESELRELYTLEDGDG